MPRLRPIDHDAARYWLAVDQMREEDQLDSFIQALQKELYKERPHEMTIGESTRIRPKKK